jgi:hypothetical protein
LATPSYEQRRGVVIRRLTAAYGWGKQLKKVETATATIFKLLLVAEKTFRRLKAPELVRQVHLGVQFEDEEKVTERPELLPPELSLRSS